MWAATAYKAHVCAAGAHHTGGTLPEIIQQEVLHSLARRDGSLLARGFRLAGPCTSSRGACDGMPGVECSYPNSAVACLKVQLVVAVCLLVAVWLVA